MNDLANTSVLVPTSSVVASIVQKFIDDDLNLNAVHEWLSAVDSQDWYTDGFVIEDDFDSTVFRFYVASSTPSLALPIPNTPQFSVSLSLSDADASQEIAMAIQDDLEWIEWRNLGLVVNFSPSVLIPLDNSENSVSIRFDATVRLFSDGRVQVIPYAHLSVPRSRIANTDVAVELHDVRFALGDSNTKTLAVLGFSTPFTGAYAKSGSLQILPMCTFSGAAGLTLALNQVAAGRDGVSFRAQLYRVAETDGVLIGINSQLPGSISGVDWSFAVKSVEIDVFNNLPNRFDVGVLLAMPLFDVVFEAQFGVVFHSALAGYRYSLRASSVGPVEMLIGGTKLSVSSQQFFGELHGGEIHLDGEAGEISLTGGPVSLTAHSVRTSLVHSETLLRLAFEVSGLDLGPLGMVENTTVVVGKAQDDSTSQHFVQFEGAVAWTDVKDRLQIPSHFPQPPDDIEASFKLWWEDDDNGTTKVKLQLRAAVNDVDALWQFVDEGFRPVLQSAELELLVEYDNATQFHAASSSGNFSGAFSIALRLGLPPSLIEQLNATNLIALNTGDETGLVDAKMSASLDANNQPTFSIAIENPLTIGINLPGFELPQAPIHIEIDTIAIDSQPAAEFDGGFAFAGKFRLLYVDPLDAGLPIPPPMAGHIKRLLESVGLDDVRGSASLTARFKAERSALSIMCQFDSPGIGLDLDLFDMLAGAARVIPAPDGLGADANEIDLDIEVGFELRRIALELGSLNANDTSRMELQLVAGFHFAGVHTDIEFTLSDKELSFGFAELAIPIKIPELPMRLDDLNQLRGDGGYWDSQKWLNEVEPQIELELAQRSNDLSGYQSEIVSLEQELPTLDDGPERAQKAARLKELKEREVPKANEASLHLSAKRFLMDGILLLHGLMSSPASRNQFQQYVQVYQGMVDATLGSIHGDTQLVFVLSDIKFVLPFDNPSDIRVEGGAQITGFAPDDPFAPLGDLIFKLGISSEYIYFSVEGGGDPIPLPERGRYKDGHINLKHIRIAYGYSKNSFAVAFAGELRLPPALVDDADTSNTIGFGVRLPVQSRLAFNLDLIPVVLGEVDFVIPLVKFDVDLRHPDTSGLVDPRTCTPAWDGLQLIVPDVVRLGFKKAKFSPFFGPIPAPNYNTSYDIMLGNQDHGMTFVCDNLLLITNVLGQYPIPFIADATPYFDNQCVNVRVAGFGVNFNVQRPFPNPSPMAIFEVMGLLSDPSMPIDPNGALANSMRATIEQAYITLPPYVVRMFPELGTVVEREVNYTLNLGTIITIAQNLAPWIEATLQTAQDDATRVQTLVQEVIDNPPDLSPSNVLAMLPAALRCFHLEGSFGGFNASAVIALMTQAEAFAEFDRRDSPPIPGPLATVLKETFAQNHLRDWQIVNQGHRRPAWRVVNGELRQTSNSHRNTLPVRPGTFVKHTNTKVSERFVLSAVLRSERGGIGFMFALRGDNQYYRFALFDNGRFELLKVNDGSHTVLFESQSSGLSQSRFNVVIAVEPTRVVVPPVRPTLPHPSRPRRPRRSAASQRIRITINGDQWCSVIDGDQPITAGTVGLYCWNNTTARFDNIHVYARGTTPSLEAGQAATTETAFAYTPSLPAHDKPLFDPLDPDNNLFTTEAFAGFDASVLDHVENPSDDAIGVVTAAQVNVFDQQVFRFLGFLFTDGHFSLVSELGIEPLALRVAGMQVPLPLTFQGRLILSGQSKGADTTAAITAQGWAEWVVLPSVLTVKAGRPDSPVSLTLHSDSRFALQGSGEALFFNGSATIAGQYDISDTHCFLRGGFDYRPNYFIAGKRVVDLRLNASGRVGPGQQFAFSGEGDIAILENEAVSVEATVSQDTIALKTVLEFPKWNELPIDEMRLALQGTVKFDGASQPDFHLQGEASLEGFKSPGGNGLRIEGVGGIQSQAGQLTTYVGGAMRWQNRDWLRGRIELGTEGVRIEGATSFALDLLDLPDNLNTQLASLYFAIDISGHFGLNQAGRLTECGLQTQWVLAVKLPGADEQLIPFAMQTMDINLDNLNVTNQLVKLIELITFDALSVLPIGDITIPVPQVTPTSHASLYVSTVNEGGGSRSISTLKTRSGTASNDLFRIPTSIGTSSTTYSIDLGPIAAGLGIPDPSVTVTTPSLSNRRSFYIGSESISLPSIPVPNLSATHTPGAVKVFEVPTDFHFDFSNQSLGNLLTHLDCTVSLGWKGMDLGIVVTKNNKDKFTPFRKMFG